MNEEKLCVLSQCENAKITSKKGQITVLAGLVFGLIVSLMVVLIESAVCMGARTKMNMAVNLGVQSLFSQYSKPVLERYEVFGGVFEKDEESRGLLYQYIQKNIESKLGDSLLLKKFSPYDITLSDIELTEKKMLTDEQGKFFYDEITEYMKYGQFNTEILDFLPEITKSQNTEDLKELNDDLEKRQKEAGKIDAKILQLLTLVEGVQTTTSGLKQSFGHLVGASSFVKKICPNGTQYGQTGVSHPTIYQAVSGHYYDITEKLSNLKDDLDFIKFIYFYPATKGMFLDVGFRTNAYNISNELYETTIKINQALALIDEIYQDEASLANQMKGTRTILQAKKGKLDANVVSAYEEEITILEKYASGNLNKLCDLADVKNKLISCSSQLQAMKAAVDSVALVEMDINSIDSVYGMIDACIEVCKGYQGAGITFNYDELSLGKGEHISMLENVKNYFSNNIYRLVIDDLDGVSKKKLAVADLSSQKCAVGKSSNSLSLDPEKLYKDFLFNRYASIHFSSYVRPNEEGLLSYELEYLIGKSMSDGDNLNEVIKQLVNLRFALDFSYIMCDMPKKMECEAKATAVLGFTGVYAVIKLGQYLLLTAWAYAEAINDAKILVKGGKVPFLKKADSWRTSLEDVLIKNLTADTGSNASGFDYVQYLQVLLLLEEKNKKVFRMMDMMECNLMQAGYAHIRMYHYVYSLEGIVRFYYRRGKYDYEQKFTFEY